MKQLRLSQQTFLLVMVPVIFELGFVGWLYAALSDIETQAEQAEEARVIATHMNRFLRSLMELIGKKRFDVTSIAPFNTSTTLKDIRRELEILQQLVKNKPEERQMVTDIRSLLTEAAEASEEMNEFISNRDYSQAYRMRDHIRPLLNKIAVKVEAMRKTEEQLEESAPHVVSRRRELIKNILILGVSLNIALAITLALITYRGIVLRLRILCDNARAFKENRPLRPSPGGDDEIGVLDSEFRDMVQSLVLARANEKTEADRVAQIVQELPLGLAIIDETGKITMANATLAMMLLKTETELIGLTLTDLFEARPNFKNLLAKGSWQAIRADGSEFPAEVSATFIGTMEGERGLILIVDVSERQEVERVKQQFVAVVSHELRTPLSSVDNFLAMIKEGMYGKLSDSGMESLNGVQSGVERLIKLTRDLLDVERLDAGHLQLDIRDTKLSEVFSQALNAVSATTSKAGVSIDVPETNIVVRADKERIVQVLVNILSNAIKFSASGARVRVTVSEESRHAGVEVTDKGPGIAPEFQTRIFDRFQQVNIDDAKKRGGAGLGLAICKLIVEQHEGAIGVESEPGEGSTFWFTLPLADSAV